MREQLLKSSDYHQPKKITIAELRVQVEELKKQIRDETNETQKTRKYGELQSKVRQLVMRLR